jgi:hypothetical protein
VNRDARAVDTRGEGWLFEDAATHRPPRIDRRTVPSRSGSLILQVMRSRLFEIAKLCPVIRERGAPLGELVGHEVVLSRCMARIAADRTIPRRRLRVIRASGDAAVRDRLLAARAERGS